MNVWVKVLVALSGLLAYAESDALPCQDRTMQNFSADVLITAAPGSHTLLQAKAADLAANLRNDKVFEALVSQKDWIAASLYFLNVFREPLALQLPCDELRLHSLEQDHMGFQHLRFDQYWQGLPVFDAQLTLHWNAEGLIYLLQGRYAASPVGSGTESAYNADSIIAITAQTTGLTPDRISNPQLGYLMRDDSAVTLVWRLETTEGLTRHRVLMVDAQTGKLLDQQRRLP